MGVFLRHEQREALREKQSGHAGHTIQYGVPFMLLYPDSIVARSASCVNEKVCHSSV